MESLTLGVSHVHLMSIKKRNTKSKENQRDIDKKSTIDYFIYF